VCTEYCRLLMEEGTLIPVWVWELA